MIGYTNLQAKEIYNMTIQKHVLTNGLEVVNKALVKHFGFNF